MGYTLLGTYGYQQLHAANTLTSTQQHERHLLPTLALFEVQQLLALGMAGGVCAFQLSIQPFGVW